MKELAIELRSFQLTSSLSLRQIGSKQYSNYLTETNESDLAVVTGTLYLIGRRSSRIMLYNMDSEKGW